MSRNTAIRLYVDTPLAVGGEISFNEEQSRYLGAVMRLAPGDTVLLFDGMNGEFSAEIFSLGKKAASAAVVARTRPFAPAADVWLLFAPVKKDRTDFIIEKATELGAGKIIPVITRHTITDKVRVERLRAQAAETAAAAALSVWQAISGLWNGEKNEKEGE